MRRAVWLLEQLRREDVEVVAPVDPRVPTGALLKDHIETMLLEHVDRSSRRRDKTIVFPGAEPHQLEALLEHRIIKRCKIAVLPTIWIG